MEIRLLQGGDNLFTTMWSPCNNLVSVVTGFNCIQWNLSIPDTIRTTVSVLIIEVSLFQGLIYTH